MKNTDVISFDEYLFTYSIGIMYFIFVGRHILVDIGSIISVTYLFQNYAHIFLLYEQSLKLKFRMHLSFSI